MTEERAVAILNTLRDSFTHVVHGDEIVEALDLAMQCVEEAHHAGIYDNPTPPIEEASSSIPGLGYDDEFPDSGQPARVKP